MLICKIYYFTHCKGITFLLTVYCWELQRPRINSISNSDLLTIWTREWCTKSFISGRLIWIRGKAAAAKLLRSCPALCDPIDGSPPGSPTPGILQARTLEWVAISFSNAGKWKVKVKSLSRVWLFGTPWTAAYQAPPSMGFSRQEYWSGVPLPSLRGKARPPNNCHLPQGEKTPQVSLSGFVWCISPFFPHFSPVF